MFIKQKYKIDVFTSVYSVNNESSHLSDFWPCGFSCDSVKWGGPVLLSVSDSNPGAWKEHHFNKEK